MPALRASFKRISQKCIAAGILSYPTERAPLAAHKRIHFSWGLLWEILGLIARKSRNAPEFPDTVNVRELNSGYDAG